MWDYVLRRVIFVLIERYFFVLSKLTNTCSVFPPVVVNINVSPGMVPNSSKKNYFFEKITFQICMDKSNKTGKTLTHTKEKTPWLPLSGTLQEFLETSPFPSFSSTTRLRSHRSVRGTSILQLVLPSPYSACVFHLCVLPRTLSCHPKPAHSPCVRVSELLSVLSFLLRQYPPVRTGTGETDSKRNGNMT